MQALRLALLKIGAVILRNTQRVRAVSSSAFPHQAIFLAAARALYSPQPRPGAVPGTLPDYLPFYYDIGLHLALNCVSPATYQRLG